MVPMYQLAQLSDRPDGRHRVASLYVPYLDLMPAENVMRSRGKTFWDWADAKLHSRTHTEVLEFGLTIDVQVRLSRVGATELFIGIYGPDGACLHEEAHKARPGQSMTTAMSWGVALARDIAASFAKPGPKATDGATEHRPSP